MQLEDIFLVEARRLRPKSGNDILQALGTWSGHSRPLTRFFRVLAISTGF